MAPCLLASGDRWRSKGHGELGVALLVHCRDTCWYRVCTVSRLVRWSKVRSLLRYQVRS